MGDWGGKFDMPKPLSPDPGLYHLNTALVADHPAVLHPLVFAAETFPVLCGPEYLCTEESVPLRLEGPVIYRLRFLYLTIGPFPDLLGRCNLYPDCIKVLRIFGLLKKGINLFQFLSPFIIIVYGSSISSTGPSECPTLQLLEVFFFF